MVLKLYTLRGKITGALYTEEGHTKNQAAQRLGIKPSLLIIMRSHIVKPHGTQLDQDPSISPHTAQYHSPRK